jgi:hypothetical protein
MLVSPLVSHAHPFPVFFRKIIHLLWIAAIFPALTLFSGCNKLSRQREEVSEPVKAVQAQIKALNLRDAEGAIAMMHPQAPGREKAAETTRKLLESYELIFMIQNISLESADEAQATVRFTQVTNQVANKTKGPNFRSNRVVGVHTLRKDAGQWKIYSTEMEKIEYFDQIPRATPLRE